MVDRQILKGKTFASKRAWTGMRNQTDPLGCQCRSLKFRDFSSALAPRPINR